MRRIIFGLLVVLVATPDARADPFTSTEFHFTADFPSEPKAQGPIDSMRDASGAVISRITTFTAGRKNLYAVNVTIDAFLRPAHVDEQKTLEAERDSAVRQGRGNLTSSTPDTVGGYAALRFTYDAPTALIKGEGVVVLVASETPRIYVVLAERTNNAGSGERAAIDRFLKSFQLTE